MLGRIDTWPQTLTTTVGILLALNEPVALAWGPELIILYNDAYAAMYGDKIRLRLWAWASPSPVRIFGARSVLITSMFFAAAAW